MFERHQTKIAVFGGDQSKPIEFKGTSPSRDGVRRGVLVLTVIFAGMAGMQVLEWDTFESEIKTAGLTNVKEKCFLSYVSLSSSPRIGFSSTPRPVRDVLLWKVLG